MKLSDHLETVLQRYSMEHQLGQGRSVMVNQIPSFRAIPSSLNARVHATRLSLCSQALKFLAALQASDGTWEPSEELANGRLDLDTVELRCLNMIDVCFFKTCLNVFS